MRNNSFKNVIRVLEYNMYVLINVMLTEFSGHFTARLWTTIREVVNRSTCSKETRP